MFQTFIIHITNNFKLFEILCFRSKFVSISKTNKNHIRKHPQNEIHDFDLNPSSYLTQIS